MADRFVNTASTPGGDGTTNATSGANRAWATLAEAANGLGTSLSTPIDLYCTGTAADTSNVFQSVWDFTTTATNKLRIIGEQSPLHPNFSTAKSGKYDTTLYRLERTNANGLYNNVPSHWEIHGIQQRITVNDAGSYVGFKSTNANQVAADVNCTMAYCISVGVVTSGSLIGFNTRFTGTGSGGISKVYNCLAIDCTTGFNSDFGTGGAEIGEYISCTAAGCNFSYVEDANMRVSHCLSTAAGSIGFVGTFAAGSDYNRADDGNSAPGANSTASAVFTFVNAAADDFHLASTDSGAKGRGQNSPSFGFTDDIDGHTRTGAWDVGFDQSPIRAISASQFSLASLGVTLNNVQANSILLVFVGWADTTQTLTSLTGATFTIQDNPTTVTTGGRIAQAFTGPVTAGNYTITANLSASVAAIIVHVIEVPALYVSGGQQAHIANVQSSAGTGTDAITSTTISVTAGGILVGYSMDFAVTTPPNIGTGFTMAATQNGSRSEYKLITATGSQAATFTETEAFADNGTMAMSFQASTDSPFPARWATA